MGGVVVVESGPYSGYQGTWHLLKEVEFQGPSRAVYVSIPGVHLAVQVRVVKAISNGSVSVYAIGS
jgi:hypothetical protein